MSLISKIAMMLFIPLLASQFTESELRIKVKTDRMLVVPGIGAENVVIKDSLKELISAKGIPERIAEFKSSRELFSDVFKQQSPIKIQFDKICYYELKKAIVFLLSGEVVAVAGLGRNRITIDSINLESGAENFLFNYGNDGLSVIRKGNDKIYIYSKIGIALFDDNGDNITDMFLVFSPH